MPQSLAFDHIALPCIDAAATYRFYTEVLGLKHVDTHVGDDWDGRPWLMLIFALGDGRQIVLTALKGVTATQADGLPRDLRHCAIATKSLVELDAWRAHLVAAGVRPRPEDHGDSRSIYFPDPSGTILEIVARVE